MKSIVEEASSIVKAIEKAWERADRPQEFTIKIFEDVQRGFLGMTKKQAKVGIFFADVQPDRVRDTMREKVTSVSPERERVRESKSTRESHVSHEKRRIVSPSVSTSSTTSATGEKGVKERRSPWTNEMEHAVDVWLAQLMQKSGFSDAVFTLKRSGNRLHVTFTKSLFDVQEKNIALFRSLSYLLLGMLRSKFKKEFRFLKVVLTAQA